MSACIEELRFWAQYCSLVAIVGTYLGVIWGLVAGIRGVRVDVLDYLVIFTVLMLGLAVGVITAAGFVFDCGMSEETQEKKPQWCWQGEFAHQADDCGQMYCELTGATWNEWMHEHECESCPFGIWNAEDWHEAMEAAER